MKMVTIILHLRDRENTELGYEVELWDSEDGWDADLSNLTKMRAEWVTVCPLDSFLESWVSPASRFPKGIELPKVWKRLKWKLQQDDFGDVGDADSMEIDL